MIRMRFRNISAVRQVRQIMYDIYPKSRGSLSAYHPLAESILKNPTIVVERQLEIMNVIWGFEQANRYVILDVFGNRIGYMLERHASLTKAILRQIYRLHRPFHVDVFDNEDRLLMSIKRPFSFINSHIGAWLPRSQGSEDDDVGMDLLGESVQRWHPWRRRYELFVGSRDAAATGELEQFGGIDAPPLSFEFPVCNEHGEVIAGVDRRWVGIGRELFTDTGMYVVRFDSEQSLEGVYEGQPRSKRVLDLDERAVVLANAVSIDFDYFSRHSRGPGGGMLIYDET